MLDFRTRFALRTKEFKVTTFSPHFSGVHPGNTKKINSSDNLLYKETTDATARLITLLIHNNKQLYIKKVALIARIYYCSLNNGQKKVIYWQHWPNSRFFNGFRLISL